ncbi:MAG: MopE-related protein, partial [Myxococcota bacterium]|nr:MopE-related protein [Myxococcota bacterium]
MRRYPMRRVHPIGVGCLGLFIFCLASCVPENDAETSNGRSSNAEAGQPTPSTAAGTSAAGQPTAGQTTGGQITAGQSNSAGEREGRLSAAGTPVAGQSIAGQTTAGGSLEEEAGSAGDPPSGGAASGGAISGGGPAVAMNDVDMRAGQTMSGGMTGGMSESMTGGVVVDMTGGITENENRAGRVTGGAMELGGAMGGPGGGTDGIECVPQGGADATERCNRIDDDCDGTTDEGYPDLDRPCVTGIGRCERVGLTRCAPDGDGTECSVVPGVPMDEACNGLDDDCDGQIDETFPDLRTPCSAGIGACTTLGVFVCSDDGQMTTCSVGPGEPGEERCNSRDDDCDGQVDENFGGLNEACTVGDGACQRVGIITCSPDGLSSVCSAEDGEGNNEICNGLDDDCDRSIDEAFPNVGQLCEVGQGTCRRNGIYVCTDDGDGTRCNADTIAPDLETCDYQDDDCDGQTDENFTDENGRYTTLANCGGCRNDCRQIWSPSPEANGVQPTCEAVGVTALCGFDCLDGFRDADGIAGNGCEFREDPAAVYVATPANGGVDANDCGASLRPCSTINLGIDIAFNDLSKTKVLVSDGLYRETVTLQPGIDVLGGHNRVNWTRNPEINTTIIRANDTQMIHAAAVYAIDITQSTTLDGFAIEGETPPSGNSYGVYVRDSDNTLQITNNRIRAGDGARGTDGVAGASGEPGTNGAAGRNAFNLNYVTEPPADNACVLGNPADPANDGQVGGLGGQKVCDGVAASGGQGGYTSCPELQRSEGNGFNGDGD